VHLEPARDARRGHPRIEDLVGALQQHVDRFRAVPLLQGPVGELGQVGRGPERHEIVAQPEPWMDDRHLGQDVERPAVRKDELQLGERFDAPADP